MNTKQETRANATTAVFGSEKMLTPAPTQNIPQHKTTPEIAYQMVKDETYPQTQPRLNLATFVTTYMDEYATRLMNEAINVNYIDETEYPRVAVMCGRCINIIANMWPSGRPARWESARRRLVCWAASRPGCAGARNARPRANPSTNPIW